MAINGTSNANGVVYDAEKRATSPAPSEINHSTSRKKKIVVVGLGMVAISFMYVVLPRSII